MLDSDGLNLINKLIIDNLNEAVFVADAEGRIINANQRSLDLFSQPNETLLGRHLAEVLPGLEFLQRDNWFEQLRQETIQSCELVLAWEALTRLLEVLVLYVHSGDNEYACVLTRDIASQRKIANFDDYQQSSLHRVLASIPDMMIRVDRTGACVEGDNLWNSEQNSLESRNRKTLQDLFSKDVASSLAEMIDESILRQTVQTVELELSGKDGSIQHYFVRVVPLDDFQAMLIGQDITNRKIAERTQEALIRQLREKNRDLERFTYRISHDLKSPIVSIRGLCKLMEMKIPEELKADFDEYFQDIRLATQNMQNLIDQILEMARLGKATVEIRLNDMVAVVEDALINVRGQAQQHQVQIQIDRTIPNAWGDRRQLTAVYQNLLDNAVKHLRSVPSPTVKVGWRGDGAETVYFVADNGAGIPTRDQERVFELFQQGGKGEIGFGFGLSIVRRIIEIHGGRIWIESPHEGVGAAFCFTLDCAPP